MPLWIDPYSMVIWKQKNIHSFSLTRLLSLFGPLLISRFGQCHATGTRSLPCVLSHRNFPGCWLCHRSSCAQHQALWCSCQEVERPCLQYRRHVGSDDKARQGTFLFLSIVSQFANSARRYPRCCGLRIQIRRYRRTLTNSHDFGLFSGWN